MNYWAEYAPNLAHLACIVETFGDVISGWSSGPQPQATDYDPNQAQELSILIADLEGLSQTQWVTITANGAHYLNEYGERWELSHAKLWAFLRTIPRPLHTFARCADY